jgi:hypothetical protein
MTPTGPDDAFVADVLARTSGPACACARLILGGEIDEPLGAPERALVDGHLEHCTECRALADTLPSLHAELRALAERDPDAGFTARVLAATSGRPRRRVWHERWAARWGAAAARPRFAWEVAYALTLVLVLLVGDPVRAWDSAAARLHTWPAPTLEVRLPAPPGVANAGRRVTSRIDAAYQWLERRTEAVTMLLSALRGDETARSSTWYAIADVTSRWARLALSWTRPLVEAFRPAPTEPRGGPVRSSDHTETNR